MRQLQLATASKAHRKQGTNKGQHPITMNYTVETTDADTTIHFSTEPTVADIFDAINALVENDLGGYRLWDLTKVIKFNQ